MPLAECEAVILRSAHFGEADKLVSFLARGLGRLRGVAPNARRSRRRFGAALEPLSHVRLWFFERPEQELVRLSESELIESFNDARGDYDRSLALNQVTELADLLLPEREPSDKAFRLLLAVLRAFKASDSTSLPLTYFQLWMVRLSGWLPALEQCSRCGRVFVEEPAYWHTPAGKLFCAKCRRPGARLLSPASRQAAAAMLSQPLDKLDPATCDARNMPQIRALLLDLVEYFSEHKLVTRALFDEKA